MDSMTDRARGIVVGVDAHTDTHDACVLDDCGRLLGTRSFSADAAGYRELLSWVGRFGPIVALGVESTGSYAAGLTRYLRAQGLEVLEVNQPHPHTRRRRGKSDPIDAELAARHVLAASRSRDRQGHHRDRRGDPSAAGRSRRRGQGAQRRAQRAGRPDRHRPRGAAPAALGAQDDTRAARRSARASAPTLAAARAVHAAKAALRSLARRVIDLDAEIARSTASSSARREAAPATTRASPSPPVTPARCWSPPGRTSSGCAAKPRSPRSAAPARSRSPPAAPTATASTTAATATPTARCT